MAHPVTALTPKALRTRQAIVSAAQEIIATEGISAANAMAICEKAGIGRTSFYNYFEDNNELLAIVAEEAANKIRTLFNDLHALEPRGLNRLEACLNMLFELSVSNGDLIRLISQISRSSDTIPNLLSSEIAMELQGAADSAGTTTTTEKIRSDAVFLSTCILAVSRQLADGKIPADYQSHLVEKLMAGCML